MRRRLRTLSLAFAAVFATLVACELAVRYLQDTIPPPDGTPYRNDPDCGYVLNPGDPGLFPPDDDRHVNPLGFRDRDRAVPKPPGMWRLVGIGDSFVYGDVPIACNFLRVLDDSLRATPPAGHAAAEAMIAGLPGWDVRNAVGLMRGKGDAWRPDVALLCFSIDSDVTGIPIPGAVFQGNLHFTGSREPLLNLLRKSRLFVLAEQLYGVRTVNALRRWRAAARFGGAAAAPAVPAAPDALNIPIAADAPEGTLHPGAPVFAGMWGDPADPARRLPLKPEFLRRRVENLPLYRTETPPEVARWWEQAERQVLEFDAACRRAGARCVLLIAPSEIQVDPVVQELTLRRAPLPAAAYDFAGPSRRLRAFAAARGIACVDPLEALRAAQQSSGLRQYIPNNGHWSVPGNAVVAREVAASLR
ncbi:MAG: hypothetical protein Q7W56_00115 [Candidatus Latescibacteria bacterium]|nr:hypothetical protein [Candidatus Latescibacterota bacterium]